MSNVERVARWEPIPDWPSGQEIVIPSPDPAVTYWGEIDPMDDGIRWSWTIQVTDDAADQREMARGVAASEAEAKAAVEAWQPLQHNDGSAEK